MVNPRWLAVYVYVDPIARTTHIPRGWALWCPLPSPSPSFFSPQKTNPTFDQNFFLKRQTLPLPPLYTNRIYIVVILTKNSIILLLVDKGNKSKLKKIFRCIKNIFRGPNGCANERNKEKVTRSKRKIKEKENK